jgi:hypothetical protein
VFRRLKVPTHAPHSKQPQLALRSSPAAAVLLTQQNLTAVKATADRKVPAGPPWKGFAATTAFECDGRQTQRPISSVAGARDNVATTRVNDNGDDGAVQLVQFA